ncbi:MAG: DUF2619 domain-containing protein [Bacillota bacterium]
MRFDHLVLAMAGLRVLFGMMGLGGAALMLWYNDVSVAVRINAVLGSVGPFVFLGVSLLGIAGMAGEIPVQRLVLVAAGGTLVLLGTRW